MQTSNIQSRLLKKVFCFGAVAAFALLLKTNCVMAQSGGGDPQSSDEARTMIVETKRSFEDESAWRESGTTIVAGGKNGDGTNPNPHEASVRITFTSFSASSTDTVHIMLSEGGEGFAPSAWWWAGNDRKRAKLTVTGQGTYTAGESTSDIVVTSGNSFSGTIRSSNRVESVNIRVWRPSTNVTRLHKVYFVVPDIAVKVGDGDLAINSWTTGTMKVTFMGQPVPNHVIRTTVNSVNILNGKPVVAKLSDTSTGNTDLSSYVELKEGLLEDHRYEEFTTNGSSPNGSFKFQVKQTPVIGFQVSGADMSVAK